MAKISTHTGEKDNSSAIYLGSYSLPKSISNLLSALHNARNGNMYAIPSFEIEYLRDLLGRYP